MNKYVKYALIAAGVALVVYFLFFRKKKVRQGSDGLLNVASEKPIVADASDPNAVNPVSGQPLRLGSN